MTRKAGFHLESNFAAQEVAGWMDQEYSIKKEMQNFVYGIAHINELLNICAKRDDVNVYGITFYNCLFLGRCEGRKIGVKVNSL